MAADTLCPIVYRLDYFKFPDARELKPGEKVKLFRPTYDTYSVRTFRAEASVAKSPKKTTSQRAQGHASREESIAVTNEEIEDTKSGSDDVDSLSSDDAVVVLAKPAKKQQDVEKTRSPKHRKPSKRNRKCQTKDQTPMTLERDSSKKKKEEPLIQEMAVFPEQEKEQEEQAPSVVVKTQKKKRDSEKTEPINVVDDQKVPKVGREMSKKKSTTAGREQKKSIRKDERKIIEDEQNSPDEGREDPSEKPYVPQDQGAVSKKEKRDAAKPEPKQKKNFHHTSPLYNGEDKKMKSGADRERLLRSASSSVGEATLQNDIVAPKEKALPKAKSASISARSRGSVQPEAQPRRSQKKPTQSLRTDETGTQQELQEEEVYPKGPKHGTNRGNGPGPLERDQTLQKEVSRDSDSSTSMDSTSSLSDLAGNTSQNWETDPQYQLDETRLHRASRRALRKNWLAI